MVKTVLGRVSLSPRGSYNTTVAYSRLDLMEHNGSSYIALKDFTGIEPTGDNVITMLIAKKGDIGSVTKEGVETVLTGDINTHTHNQYCTITYVEGVVGNLNTVLDAINGEVI